MVLLSGCQPGIRPVDDKNIDEARRAMEHGDYKAARLRLEKETKRPAPPEDLVRHADALALLARCYRLDNRPKEARASIDRSIKKLRKKVGNDAQSLIPLFTESHYINYRAKRFEQAESDAREVLRLQRMHDKNEEHLIDTLNLVIASACAGDRCADTAPLIKEQLALRLKYLGEEHEHVAVSYCLLGEVAEKKGDFKEALSYFQKALAIRKKTNSPYSLQTEKNISRIGEKLHNTTSRP